MAMFRSIAALICLTFHLYGGVEIDKMMSPQDQQKTGISTLTPDQLKALDGWISQNFVAKFQETSEVSLSLNIEEGRKLQFSDGSLYEVAPSDVTTSANWISPFNLKTEPSGDPDYPVKLINPNSGSSVKARLVK